MPVLERLKQELAIHKQLFFACIAIVFGLTGWMVTHLSQPWFVIAGGVASVIAFTIFGLSQYKRMYQLLQEIEDA